MITVVRGDASSDAHVAFIAVGDGHPCGGLGCTATPPDNGETPADFGPTKGWLNFPPGVRRESFSVPIVDHHFATIAKTVSLGLFASYPQSRGPRTHAVLRILGDDPATRRRPQQPARAARTPRAGDPLRGARFFVDPEDDPGPRRGQPIRACATIADEPGVARFGAFSGADVGLAVNRFLVRADAQGPGTIPMLATYELVDGRCGRYAQAAMPLTTGASSRAWPTRSAATAR